MQAHERALVSLCILEDLLDSSCCGSVVERSKPRDCRSRGFGLRWFESNPAHKKPKPKHVLGFVHFL